MRACRERGIAPIAVHSSIDRGALHVREADEAIEIGGPAPARELPAHRRDPRRRGAGPAPTRSIPATASSRRTPRSPRACRDAGVIFVGPPPEAITAMGSKLGARERMERAGVPVVPGATPADQTDAGIRAAALRHRPAGRRQGVGRRRRQGHARRHRRRRARRIDRRGPARGDARLRRRHALRRALHRAAAPRRDPGLRATRTAAASTSSSASARSSGATRRSSRRRRRRR